MMTNTNYDSDMSAVCFVGFHIHNHGACSFPSSIIISNFTVITSLKMIRGTF